MENNKRVRLRFAPSPTGPLHIGGVRTALFNYLFAKKHGGDFLLSIEDTDQTRYVPGAEEYIIESLKWCGIVPDEGVTFGGPHEPYRQSERKQLGIYSKYALQLIESGHAYYAFDTSEELDEMRKRLEAAKVAAPQYNSVSRENMKNSLVLPADEVQKRLDAGEPYVIRLKVPRNEEIRIKDIIRGWVVVNSSQVDDKVLLKADGMPTYHLAHVVDDILMDISHVVRGEEWLPSAPAHVLIYKYLGLEEIMPQYAHLPLLLKPDGNGKLSKRDGDRLGFPVFPLEWKDPSTGEVSSGYREKGYIAQGFVNMLALLGWNPGNNEEIFTLDELVSLFSFEKVSKAGAKFDPEKAKWFNQQYLRKSDESYLANEFINNLQVQENHAQLFAQNPLLNDLEYVKKFCGLIREKAQFVNEFWSLGSYFFSAPTEFDVTVVSKKWNADAINFYNTLCDNWQSIQDFSSAKVEEVFKETATNLGQQPNQWLQLTRVAISGIAGGPQFFELVALIGKETCISRIKYFVSIQS
jgi:glutamyl-tRNA synthetase